MAEDLDELLDEVESKFCRNVSVTPPSPSSGKEDGGNFSVSQTPKKAEGKSGTHGSTNQEPCKNREDEDINALLEDIFDDDYDSLNFHTAKATKTDSKNSLPQPAGRRCCPVFIGGSSIPSGVGTSISQRACSQLRCTSCDFRVTSFDDHVWDLSCDYLFFRNNMPDCQKLRAKLRRKRNARAYACQCSWHSTLLLTDLRDQPELKWVCGKHEA
ncbi:hypothetical protein AAFF_G00164610 [Aldrovandia affinis]|uniref:Cilia- and flagella-associated protein 418 n=1 Tax=Aldrovandia affinis TaxID=143900 RepID=A0AAD7SZM8_9TELE|nr:hypothetical protein AAFF_G00164610 [Aldrovandia affinis]